MSENKQVQIKSETDLKLFLHKNYMAQIQNFFGDEKQAMKFLSSVMADVQKNPKLLECEPVSLVNSYMTMAQLGLMPSGVSGEAYVLPYAKNKKNPDNTWTKTVNAQFQLGYQGLITLFYRAGGTGLRAEVVRKNDKFSYLNGTVHHEIDIFQSNAERGEVIGAYAIGNIKGQEMAKAMNIKDILTYKEFSKSKDSEFSPWNSKNDPDDWMPKKTVLKQLMKLLPKNETIHKAIAYDNEDSRMSDVVKLRDESNLKMGNLLKSPNEKNNKAKEDKKQIVGEDVAESDESADGREVHID